MLNSHIFRALLFKGRCERTFSEAILSSRHFGGVLVLNLPIQMTVIVNIHSEAQKCVVVQHKFV